MSLTTIPTHERPVASGRYAAPERCTAKIRTPTSTKEKSYTGPPVVRELIGSLDERVAGPQAFAVDVFPPNSRFGAHFHAVDQFQIFFGAPEAWYQRSPIDDVLIHYTDAYTTYGPFGTGIAPMRFMTFRPSASDLTAFMPGSRDKLVRRGRRNLHVPPGPPSDELLTGTETVVTDLVEPQGDGLRIARATVPPGHPVPDVLLAADAPVGTSGGQYIVVLAGSFAVAGELYGRHSVGWADPDTRLDGLSTGPDGLDALVLRFARPTDGP